MIEEWLLSDVRCHDCFQFCSRRCNICVFVKTARIGDSNTNALDVSCKWNDQWSNNGGCRNKEDAVAAPESRGGWPVLCSPPLNLRLHLDFQLSISSSTHHIATMIRQ